MKTYILPTLLFMAGCSIQSGEPMTNEQIIEQINICKDAGLGYRHIKFAGTETAPTLRIECEEKKP